jgi:isoquinoline 1-oxidoreductase subunit alpha
MAKVTELQVNGARYPVEADEATPLLVVLREQLGLTGTKYGCGEGQCGACTVLLDGNPRRSCSTPAGKAAGHAITTIEGLASNGRLHPLQKAFLDAGAFQCGYCTSGMIMTASALLRVNPHPSEDDVRRFMDGNICRCGTYLRIIEAVRSAAETMAKRKS